MLARDPGSTANISVITTVLNEGDSIGPLIESILGGTRLPVEIVVADGGSSDQTLDHIDAYQGLLTPVVVLEATGDRSSGRNAAVEASSSSRIASIDAGCIARSDWLEQIEAAFDEGADWIGAFYVPRGRSRISTAIGLTMVYVMEEATGHFIPSARSMAFTREVWEKAGRFPTGTQFAEDTMFADRLLLQGHALRFLPEAIVEWAPPGGLSQLWATMRAWGYGDGVAGLRGGSYKRSMIVLITSGSLVLALAILKPVLTPLALLPIVVLVYERTRFKYRHAPDISTRVWIPLASLLGMIASLIGFMDGRAWRKRAERSV